MSLRQKYTEANNQVSLSMDVLFDLAGRSDKVCDQIFNALEMIDNNFTGDTTLGHRISSDDGEVIFIEIKFKSNKKGEYDVFKIYEVDTDRY